MRPLVYLASYPRSGNTFTRALLANYFGEIERPLSTQEIAHFGFGEDDEALLTRFSGLEAGRRTVEDEWMARRPYFEAIRQTPGDGPIFLKTHTLNGYAFGLPAFEFEPTDKIVYILRHPLDVVVSGAEFFGIDQRQMAARMTLPGATNHSGGAHFEIVGSWVENVGGWLNETRVPLLVVRFEDLRKRPAAELRRVLEFVGWEVVPQRLYRAARNASFQHLKTSQETEGFFQGPGRDPRTTFFREGKSGRWRKNLAPEVAQHLADVLAEPMTSLRYGGARRG